MTFVSWSYILQDEKFLDSFQVSSWWNTPSYLYVTAYSVRWTLSFIFRGLLHPPQPEGAPCRCAE